MECIDFDNEIIVNLTTSQEKHLSLCLKCRLKWEDSGLERAIINQPFDAAKEPVVDLIGKPPSTGWISPAFREKLREAKKQQKVAGLGTLDRIDEILTKLYPANQDLKKKLYDIAGKIRSQLHPVPIDFDERYVAAVYFFPEKEATQMSEKELTDKISDRLESI